MYSTNATVTKLYEPIWLAKKAQEAATHVLDIAGCRDGDELCRVYKADYKCTATLAGSKPRTVAELCPRACHTDKIKCAQYPAYAAADEKYKAAIKALSGSAAMIAVENAAKESNKDKIKKLKELEQELVGGKKPKCTYGTLPPNSQCKPWCSSFHKTKGIKGCAYKECTGCSICCTGCFDRYDISCRRWIKIHGCNAQLEINGSFGKLSSFCKKSCKICK